MFSLICLYGGSLGVRTHISQRVVNHLNRFHWKCEFEWYTIIRSSPVLSASPNDNRPLELTTLSLFYYNSRLPPYSHPTVVVPLVRATEFLFHGRNCRKPRNARFSRRSNTAQIFRSGWRNKSCLLLLRQDHLLSERAETGGGGGREIECLNGYLIKRVKKLGPEWHGFMYISY